MSFQTGISGNPNGRPRGSKTRVEVPKSVTRHVLKAVCDRAMNGDERAQELVLQAMLYRPDLTGLKPADGWT